MIFYDIQMKCAFFGFCSVLFSLTLTKRAIMRYPVPWYMLCDNNSKTQFGHALNHKIKCVDFGYNTTIFLVWFAILLLLLLLFFSMLAFCGYSHFTRWPCVRLLFYYLHFFIIICFVRMSATGASDTHHTPHTFDSIWYVMRGRARVIGTVGLSS